jgi:hypothetical protein
MVLQAGMWRLQPSWREQAVRPMERDCSGTTIGSRMKLYTRVKALLVLKVRTRDMLVDSVAECAEANYVGLNSRD